MRALRPCYRCCCCLLLWAAASLTLLLQLLPAARAHPVTPAAATDADAAAAADTYTDTNKLFKHWESNWLKYTVGLFSITITAFTLVGCLCCRRNRRPKGFQDSTGSINKEFKDGGSVDNDSSLPQLHGLELQVPVPNSPQQQQHLSAERVQFEPLPPVERFAPDICVSPRPKPPPPSSPSLFDEGSESERSTLHDSCHEWFQKTDLHVPREKLKYLREIGHGWFGKVVEGCADIQATNSSKTNAKGGNVVVRILTEEATAKEKAWFLGEATPYFKLRHRNILSLFGSCLETDPYLLLFESCPLGDLKSFLRSNQDPETRAALVKENMPTRIAIEIGAGLRHMHQHRLAHTDLSARNCLVASDLSIKLGDYGTGVEKYPEDYYVLGDRALPIRWSAPETIECTETTIETREITPRANLWSYAVLMWEIAMWGKRPYDELGDEKIFEMLLSSQSGLKPVGSQLLLQNCDNCASNLLEAIKTCLVLEPEKRLSLEQIRHVLLKDQLEAENSDFEQRWINLRPNVVANQTRSASLQDLRGSLDSEQWPSLTQTSFRLGPEEPVKNAPGGTGGSSMAGRSGRWPFRESDSETEEESWRGRVERGAYTEKVKQKSKSVADLMVLVHIEPDSDADLSLGPQTPMLSEKAAKKRLPATGSDGDLPSAVFDDQFDLALRKLREEPLQPVSRAPAQSNQPAPPERPKLLTLTVDQGQTPILRLAFDQKAVTKVEPAVTNVNEDLINGQPDSNTVSSSGSTPRRLVSKDKSEEPVLFRQAHQLSSVASSAGGISPEDVSLLISEPQVTDLDEEETEPATVVENVRPSSSPVASEYVDMGSWNSALDTALERKAANLEAYEVEEEEPEERENEEETPVRKIRPATSEEPITPSPQSRAEYSAEDAEDEFSNAEDLPGLSRRNLPLDDEDERKRMSTPDDERSSDSGFRDKESCEEEESPLAGPLMNLVGSQPNTPKFASLQDEANAEDEQMRILIELDTILDAECLGASLSYPESLEPKPAEKPTSQESEMLTSNSVAQRDSELELETSEATGQSSSETTGETEREVGLLPTDKSSASDDINPSTSVGLTDGQVGRSDGSMTSTQAVLASSDEAATTASVSQALVESSSWPCLMSLEHNEDEDSSTMSMRSDNSYVSFGMDEEFVAAIRNELREKLPHAQMSVVEAQEPHDEDEPSLVSDLDSKNWDDEVEDELADRTGVIDISIRYNTFGTPLSPIMEERDSAGNSESANLTRDDSRDASIASKGGSNSISEDDVLLIDTQTNRATLVEGVSSHSQESQELLNHDVSDAAHFQQCPKPSYPLEKRFGGILTGGTGAPLPSPEEEACKWQQMPGLPMLPLQFQDNLMSTSFASEQDWDSNGEEEGEEGPSESVDMDEDDDGEDGVLDDDDDDDDDDSSSSGQFVWQHGSGYLDNHETENSQKLETSENTENDLGGEFESEEEEEDDDEDDEDEEEEFTPSAWDATLAPHRSALRSPDKSLRSGDQKKSVWFKKQRYHCVYEYPKETPPAENQSPAVSAWEATSYTDWEEMIDNIDRINFQPMDYFETNNTRGDEEFFVSSSNRPFQFQSRNGTYVCQFFPGAGGSSDSAAVTSQEGPSQESQGQSNDETASSANTTQQFFSDRQQLGELRHTRDRLKLDLVTSSSLPSNGNNKVKHYRPRVRQGNSADDNEDDEDDDEVDGNVNNQKTPKLAEKNGNEVEESKPSDTCKEDLAEEAKKEADGQVSSTAVVDRPPVTPVKTSPSDGQCATSSDSFESKSKRDDLDVD